MTITLPRRPAPIRSSGATWTPPAGLTGALALVTATAAAGTFFGPGVLLGSAAMNGSARGTALVVLVLALPLLLGSALLARLGSARAPVVWLGTAGYLAYNAVLFLFATPFNRFFPAYVSMLTLSLAAIGSAAARLPAEALAGRLRRDAWTRGVAAYVWLVVAFNALAWLKNVVPALADPESAPFLTGTGLPTNPIYVQDLAVWLPLATLLAVWLWQGRAWGFAGTGAILVLWAIESVSVALDQDFGARADRTSTVVSGSLLWPFLGLAALGVVPLVLLLRRPRRRRDRPRARRRGRPGPPTLLSRW